MPSWKDYLDVVVSDAKTYACNKKKDLYNRLQSKAEIKAMDILPELSSKLKKISDVLNVSSKLCEIVDETLRDNSTRVQHRKEVLKHIEKITKETDVGFTYFSNN